MIGGPDAERRKELVLRHLAERRAVTDGEADRLRAELTELARREAELRDEIALLDAILGALPRPVKESDAPSLFARTPAPPPSTTVGMPMKKRRRKGSRREELLPKLQEKFGSGTFTSEDVTDLIMAAEPGERRKAYFAAWALSRDLVEDGWVDVVAEEGTGRRKRRTYRFVVTPRPSEPPIP